MTPAEIILLSLCAFWAAVIPLVVAILPDPTPNPAPYDDQAEYRAAGGAR